MAVNMISIFFAFETEIDIVLQSRLAKLFETLVPAYWQTCFVLKTAMAEASAGKVCGAFSS